jgi:hypothetical protein
MKLNSQQIKYLKMKLKKKLTTQKDPKEKRVIKSKKKKKTEKDVRPLKLTCQTHRSGHENNIT